MPFPSYPYSRGLRRYDGLQGLTTREQAIVCIVAISTCKAFGLITYRDFNTDEARKWFPIALLLIGMIYTSTKALQFLSIPVYTIFKNLTIILIAYGEVLWFGGSVSGMALISFGLMVLSSVIAAWADIQHVLTAYSGDSTTGEAGAKLATLNAGYIWMMLNCFCSASFVLGMRKRIKLTNFKDFDSEFICKKTPNFPIYQLLTCCVLSKPCSTTISSPFPFCSFARFSPKTGPRPISPLTFPPVDKWPWSAPWSSPVSAASSSPTPAHGVCASLRRQPTPWSAP